MRVTAAYPTLDDPGITERTTVAAPCSRRPGDAAAAAPRPLVPDVRLELTMPPLGDGSFTGCWASTRPSPACVGTVPERLPRRRAAPQVARAGPSQKIKAQFLRCGGAPIASPRAASRAEALPLASLVVAGT